MSKDPVQEKLKEYEAFVSKIADENARKIGKVVAGPSSDGYYRIASGNDDKLAHLKPGVTCEIGDKVITVGNFIISVLPEALNVTNEDVPDFIHIKWEDIGGIKSQIGRIRETIEYPVRYKKLYQEFGLEPSKGILLYGPPGCGKTMIAKAIATTLLSGNKIKKNAFVYMKGGEMLSPFVGVTENNIKQMFESCRQYQLETGERSVLFIDEAEAILPERGSRRSSDVDKTIVPSFLAEMDGFATNGPFIILATNFKTEIDSAVRRAGRIDLEVEISRPDKGDIEDIFRIYFNKTKLSENIEILCKVATTELSKRDTLLLNVSGSLISNIVSTAILNAIKRLVKDPKMAVGITAADVELAINHY